MTAAVSEALRDKARRLLWDARVELRQVVPGGLVVAGVRGDTGEHIVTYAIDRAQADMPWKWSCTCPARVPCSHIAAVQLVCRREQS